MKYFFIDQAYCNKGFGTVLLRNILKYLCGHPVFAERINISWMPLLKLRAADPDSRATRFFVERFVFVHGRTVTGVYDFLTKSLKLLGGEKEKETRKKEEQSRK
jgi:hypothetical protein